MKKIMDDVCDVLAFFGDMLFQRSRKIDQLITVSEAKLKILFYDGIFDLSAAEANGCASECFAFWAGEETQLEKQIRQHKIEYFFTTCAASLFGSALVLSSLWIVVTWLSIVIKLLAGWWLLAF